MKGLLIVVCSLYCININAQYYYNDIVANGLSNQHYKLVKQNKIKKVKATSYDPMGDATEGFSIQQEVSADNRKIMTTTQLPNNGKTTLTAQYENNRIKKTTGYSHGVETTTSYTYNDKGLPVTITSSTIDTAVDGGMSEVHNWFYNAAGIPSAMQKIKNKTDTTFVDFIYDDKGNIAEEKWIRKGKKTETYYYYYNDQKLVTDIVKFNTRARQLLPEFLYEYDAENRIIKMTQVTNGGSNYLVWTYTYNDKGHKQTEVCYNKQKQLMGKIEYSYEF